MHPTARHSGMTLIEILIAVTVFSVLLVMAFESLMGLRSYVGMESDRNDMEWTARFVTNEVIADLGNAARFSDAAGLRFPLVVQSGPADARDDTLEFIRIRASSVTATAPQQERPDWTDIEHRTPIALSDYANARPIHFLVLDSTAVASQDLSRLVQPVWESGRTGLNAAQNSDPNQLRHFLYQVIDRDTAGLGRLVRRYWNGNGNAPPSYDQWPIDRELATGVKSLAIDTSDALQALLANSQPVGFMLAANQIRLSLVLRRNLPADRGNGFLERRCEITGAMRSITTGN